ncbi:hypothetical protein MUP65_00305 [Patescibacteria group bacterium]|nr:hypothetical protein [Patescibacteria group bacterium]
MSVWKLAKSVFAIPPRTIIVTLLEESAVVMAAAQLSRTKDMTKKNSQTGISLIETLLALGIMVSILAIITSSFMVVLIRSAKTRILKDIEEEGKYAFRIIEQNIRVGTDVIENSEGEICVNGQEMDYVNILKTDGSKIEFGCLNKGSVEGQIVSFRNGLVDDNLGRVDRLTTATVKIDDCSFTCYEDGFEKPKRVDVSFSLSQAQATTRVEEEAAMDFQTTVVLRNF